MKSFEHLKISLEGDLCWITITRELDRNSINSAVMEELTQLLDAVEVSQARALIFKGAGDLHFVGGADGIEMMRCDSSSAREFSAAIQGVFNRIDSSPLITVAAISGQCFGGGFELALACDFRLATKSSRIGLPEVKVGLIPGGGGTQRLPRVVGEGRALQIILSGKLYSADEAQSLGMIHETVEESGLDDAVVAWIKPILRSPQYALSLAKGAVKSRPLEEGLKGESELFSKCFERGFFRELMIEQLKVGKLTTTEDVSSFIGK